MPVCSDPTHRVQFLSRSGVSRPCRRLLDTVVGRPPADAPSIRAGDGPSVHLYRIMAAGSRCAQGIVFITCGVDTYISFGYNRKNESRSVRPMKGTTVGLAGCDQGVARWHLADSAAFGEARVRVVKAGEAGGCVKGAFCETNPTDCDRNCGRKALGDCIIAK